MYKIAENTELIKEARGECSSYMKSLEKLLKDEFNISSQISLVGSAKRKLITSNGHNNNFDFDYNIFIYDGMKYDPFVLKRTIQTAFNKIMKQNGLKDVDDSTSSLTSKPMVFDNDPSNTYFHIDLGIITKHGDSIHRLIHDKRHNRMFWNIVAPIDSFTKKERAVKGQYWAHVCNTYIKKKNLYMNDKEHHPSFICYKEAINQVYDQHVRPRL